MNCICDFLRNHIYDFLFVKYYIQYILQYTDLYTFDAIAVVNAWISASLLIATVAAVSFTIIILLLMYVANIKDYIDILCTIKTRNLIPINPDSIFRIGFLLWKNSNKGSNWILCHLKHLCNLCKVIIYV